MITADNFTLEQINSCAFVSQECHEKCLESNTDHTLDRCIEITRNCSVFCKFTLLTMNADVGHADIYFCICADMCNRCASECEKFDHPFLLRCAVICRQCAAACQAMVDDAVRYESVKARALVTMQ
jgi:hypothetical protein